jgi:hypothetical protein
MKKIFNPKKPLLWVILGVILTAIIITIIVINHFNSVDIGIIGGADGPTSIIVSDKNDNPVFQATILEVNGDLLLVKPDPQSDAAKSADKIQIPLTTVDAETRSQLKAGAEIIVEYDGTLQETYPATVLNLYNIYVIY